jgi:hypothetical protein
LKRIVRIFSLLAVVAILLVAGGCKSYWIDATVENQTGLSIRELEVDYPSASFGSNGLAPGATMHYRFQIRGTGPVKVGYSTPDGKTTHAQGLTLAEHQQGGLTIRLLPQGKVEFLPSITPAS